MLYGLRSPEETQLEEVEQCPTSSGNQQKPRRELKPSALILKDCLQERSDVNLDSFMEGTTNNV